MTTTTANTEHPTATDQPAPARTPAARLELRPNRPGRCPSPCSLQARCRRTGPPENDCPMRRRPTENGPTAPVPPQTGPTAPTPPGTDPRQDEPNRTRPEHRTQPRPPKRRPREDEWSPGRMQGVTKPSWGGKFASKMRGESGMSTAEYAVGTLAAVAFAGALLKVLTSSTVQGALTDLIERALS